MNFLKNNRTFIVAEIGNNHEGSLSVAKKLIDQAKMSGVDAVKFQTIDPKNLMISDKKRLRQLEKFSFSNEKFIELYNYTKKKKLIFMSTPFSVNGAIFLNKYQNIFKISSGDNNFYSLIKCISNFNKTIFLSTGLTNIKQIQMAKKIIYKIWSKKRKNRKILALLHCVSNYPTQAKEANLLAIKNLKKNFPKCIIGYSDHTVGINASIAAVCLGSRVIEKHFTLDHNYSSFRDHRLSADPNEMKLMVNSIREIESMMGDGEKIPRKSEMKNTNLFRRSIVAKKNLVKGHKIKLNDLNWLRPGNGLAPGKEKKIIGRILKKDFAQGEQINLKFLKNK